MTRITDIVSFKIGLTLALIAGAGGMCTVKAAGTEDIRIRFSVDAGSDMELSDPRSSGNGVLDPGDLYDSDVSIPLGGGGVDGSVDDASWSGADPVPDAGESDGRIRFHMCSFDPTRCFDDFFDLDGYDAIDIDLAAILDANQPLVSILEPEDFTPDERRSIYSLEHIAISFDDDNVANWTHKPSSPTYSLSPGGSRFGSTIGNDEILSVRLVAATGGAARFTVGTMVGAAAESELHDVLAGNPDADDSNDDDVDALDAFGPEGPGTIQYFSADHEADDGLSTAVYQFDGVSLQQVIKPGVHLGMPGGVDINAFEFVWMIADEREYSDDIWGLAIIYSVDNNDPDTALRRENGMRRPGRIYGSFMDGVSFLVAEVATAEDIDAIAAAPLSFNGWDQATANPDLNP